MALKDKVALLADLLTFFNDNTSGDITPQDMRDEGTNIIDSFLNLDASTPEQTIAGDVDFTGAVNINGVPLSVFGDEYSISKSDALTSNSTTTPLIKVSSTIPSAAPSGQYHVHSRCMFSGSSSSRDAIFDLQVDSITEESNSEITINDTDENRPFIREYEITHITGADTDLDFRFWRGTQAVTIDVTFAAIVFYRVS